MGDWLGLEMQARYMLSSNEHGIKEPLVRIRVYKYTSNVKLDHYQMLPLNHDLPSLLKTLWPECFMAVIGKYRSCQHPLCSAVGEGWRVDRAAIGGEV